MPGERFHVRLLPEDGAGGAERVVVEVGLEGFNILDASGSRNLREYPLHHISRWSMRGSSLVLFTRSPADVEDRQVTLQGDETTVRSVLDTLTCSCMQMAEMLQNGQGSSGAGQVVANSLNALLKKSKKPALLTADQVEYWHHPEKAGWMHSQGEHIKTWRKRWFVLKQGFLFRFAGSDISSASKPRGIVDLSTVTDVTDGSATTGRANSIKLSTASGHVCYLCESETSQVEWFSALEGAVAKIVKLVAGVEDEQELNDSHSSSKSWVEQLERTYASVGSGSGPRQLTNSGSTGGSSKHDSAAGARSRPQMVSVVNYDTQGPGAARVGDRGAQHRQSGAYGGEDFVTVDYGSIAGATAVAHGEADRFQPPAAVYSSTYGSTYGQQSQVQQAAYGAYQPRTQPEYMPQTQQHGAYEAGGNLMDAVTAPQAAHQLQNNSPWKVHYTAEGRPYFYNAATGVTQWHAPA